MFTIASAKFHFSSLLQSSLKKYLSELWGCMLFRVVVQSFLFRFPVKFPFIFDCCGILESNTISLSWWPTFHIPWHASCKCSVYSSFMSKEQGMVTQDPQGTSIFCGTSASNFPHKAPETQHTKLMKETWTQLYSKKAKCCYWNCSKTSFS